MTDRLNEIKARLDKATPGPWTVRMNEFYKEPDIVKPLGDERYQYLAKVFRTGNGNDADLIAHCPDDIAWLIAELEKERAENARLLDINHGLQMQLDEHLGEQPKVCADCITNYHTICQWEIEYKPGCVCGCHLTRNLAG